MPDLLIRGISDTELAAIDSQAEVLGVSRNAYIKRTITEHLSRLRQRVTVADMEQAAQSFADLKDDAIMDQAWRCEKQ